MSQSSDVSSEDIHSKQASDNKVQRSLLDNLRIWIIELRPPFLTASIIPVLLGTVVALNVADSFDALYFGLTMAGMLFLHSGTNVLNDYYDFIDGVDKPSVEPTPFSGGSGLLANGTLQPKSVFHYSLSLLILGTLIGLYITYQKGWVILLFGIMGLISGVFYSASPIKLANRGVGELFVGLNFGPLVVIGTYYVQTRSFAIEPVIASLPIGFLIAAVLYINEFPDYSADKEAGKANILVRLGKERGVIVYYFLMASTYLSIILGMAFGFVPLISILALATIPLSYKAVMNVRRNYDDVEKLLPANALTILIHLVTGVLLCVAYVADHVL